MVLTRNSDGHKTHGNLVSSLSPPFISGMGIDEGHGATGSS